MARNSRLTENDLKMAEILEGYKFKKILSVRVSYCVITVVICYTLLKMNNFSAEQILAFASVVASAKLSFSISVVFNVGLTIAVLLERKGKKRAIQLKGKLQKQLETEQGRTSSGLSSRGEHPNDY